MSILKKTVIDQIEITRTGRVQVRFGVLLIENDKEIDKKWHRSAVEPGESAKTMLAAVNVSLLDMEKAPVTDDGMVGALLAAVSAVHTPEVIAAWQLAQQKASA